MGRFFLKNNILLCLLLVLSLIQVGSIQAADKQEMTKEGANFRVSYKSKIEPLPLYKIHSWVLHVETLDNKPAEKAVISVDGGMPAHRHGLPTQPQVSELGNGDYLVEGIKFSMTGHWEIWFKIDKGNVSEELKFDINL
jgi:hypothetical protein